MIRNIKLTGFKCFEEVAEIDLKPFTLLAGLNSSGKSSVIQALLIANNLFDNKRSVLPPQITGTRELINDNCRAFKIEYTDEADDRVTIEGTNDGIEVEWFFEENALNPSFKKPDIHYMEAGRIGSRATIHVDETEDGIKPNGDNLIWFIEKHRGDIVAEPLRHPKSGGNSLLMNLRAWMGIISPGVWFDYRLDLLSKVSSSIFDDHKAINSGFGLSYTLPLIAQILSASVGGRDSMLLLENPEAHLHPRGQTEMGKLIAACADSGVRVIVETHSDHLFDGIRIYAKHHKGFAEKFVGYWLEHTKDKGTTMETIRIDNDGRYGEVVPEGFFDQFEINSMELMQP